MVLGRYVGPAVLPHPMVLLPLGRGDRCFVSRSVLQGPAHDPLLPHCVLRPAALSRDFPLSFKYKVSDNNI